MNNGDVTRYVTEGVTAPQPNPTQPKVLTVVGSLREDVNSIHQAVTRGPSMDGHSAARFGGAR